MPRKLFLPLICGLTLWISPHAYAAMDTPLKTLPGKPSAVVLLESDPTAWKYFATRKPFSQWQQNPDLQEFIKMLAQKGIKLERDLLPNLGTHLALAFYPGETPQTSALICALSLKSADAAKLVQTKVLEVSKENTITKKTVGQNTLYWIEGMKELSDKGEVEKKSLGMLQQGETLLLAVNPRPADLKMLESPASGTLLKDPSFHEVAEQMKDEKVWVYADQTGVKQLIRMIASDDTSSAQQDSTGLDDAIEAFITEADKPSPKAQKEAAEKARQTAEAQAERETNEMAKLTRGLGLGMNPSREGLELKAYIPANTNLPQLKHFFEQMQTPKNSPAMSGVWSYLPEKPLMVVAGQNLNAYFDNPLPPLGESDTQELRDEMQKLMPEVLKGFAKATGLDLKEDLQAHLDGRFALTLSAPGIGEGGLMAVMNPDAKAYGTLLLGIKQSAHKAFFENFEHKLKVDLAAFDDPQAEKQAAVIDNLNSLKGMLAAYGDRHHSRYPARLAQLVQDSQAGKYAQTITNPLNKKSGLGLGLGMLDYATYQSYKPQASFAGMVFYAPYGKPNAAGFYPGYQLYGYAPNGTWWNVAYNKDSQQLASNLPKINLVVTPHLVPFEKLSYKSATLHIARLAKAIPDWELKNVQPSWTEAGDFLAIGLNPESLQMVLDDAKKPARSGQLAQLLKSHQADQKTSLLYVDLSQMKNLLKEASESQGSEEAVDPFAKAMKYLYMEQRFGDQAWGGGLMLGMDMDNLDFEALFKSLEGKDGKAKPKVPGAVHSLLRQVETVALK